MAPMPVRLLLIGALALTADGRVALSQNPPASGTAVPTQAAAPADSGKKLLPEQLQPLVAPIALFPDALLAQTLVASTYPLEIIQLQQWLAKHPALKDQALVDSVAKQPWDPSIQSLAALPDLVKRLADDIQWTTDLGNAFLAQQSDVMDAVQVMRSKAKKKGALTTTEQQTVETKVVEKTEVIVIESASPEVVYVPSYSPAVVYGPPPYPYYPYPPIYYPPYPPGGMFISFTVGVMWGSAMWGGSCCHAGWGGNNNIIINNNNNFNRIDHHGGRGNGGRGGNWQHNPKHRGGAPYPDQGTANKFGGSNRGAGVSDRSAGVGNRAGVSDRSAGGGSLAGVSDRSAGGGSRAGVSDRSAASSNRAGVSDRGAGGGGSDRIGSRDLGGRASSQGAFGGSYDGSRARASGSRGASSMGSRGGGVSRGGGGRRR